MATARLIGKLGGRTTIAHTVGTTDSTVTVGDGKWAAILVGETSTTRCYINGADRIGAQTATITGPTSVRMKVSTNTGAAWIAPID